MRVGYDNFAGEGEFQGLCRHVSLCSINQAIPFLQNRNVRGEGRATAYLEKMALA